MATETVKPAASFTPPIEAHIQAILSLEYANIYYEMGVGKCVSTLEIFKRLKRMGLVKTMLILAPPKVATGTWPAEITKWENFSDLKFRVLHGPKGKQHALLPADIYIAPYTALRWLPAVREVFDVVVADEGQKLKDRSTFTSKAAVYMGSRAKRRLVLSGNPRGEHLQDLFPQMKFLDRGRTLGATYGEFFGRWLRKNGPYEIVNRDGASEEITKLIAPFSFRLSLEDAGIQMPPLYQYQCEVHLPKEAQAQYDELEKEFFLQIGEIGITSANAAVLSGKCRQFASGVIYGEGKVPLEVHDSKIQALKILADREKPLLVAYEFTHHKDHILKHFPSAKLIAGGTDANELRTIMEDWNNGEINMLLVQYKSGSYGLNLQGVAADVVQYSPVWSSDDTVQITRRVWRRGQQHPVNEWKIITLNTIDEIVKARAELKISSQDEFFQALVEYRARKGV